jgi:hypothetical protein
MVQYLKPIIADLGALYGPLIPHMLPATLHCMGVNVCEGTKKLRPLHPGQELELKPKHH